MINRFIDAGLTDTPPHMSTTCVIEGYTLYAPVQDPQSGVLLVGLPDNVASDSLPLTPLGWGIVAPDKPSKFSYESFLRRLGISPSRTLIVAFPQAWAQAAQFAEKWASARLVLCGLPGLDYEEIFSRVWTSTYAPSAGVNTVLNIVNLQDRTTFLLPQSQSTHCINTAQCATYPDEIVFPRVPYGLTNLLTAIMQLPAVLAGNGDIRRFCERYWSGKSALLPSGFFPHLYGEYSFGRQVRIQLQVGSEGIHLFGYDLLPSKPAQGWASRSHKLTLRSLTGGSDHTITIGNLHREILDVLPLVATAGSTQSYGVFAVRNNDPIPIDLLEDGIYEVEVLDERGDNITPWATVRILDNHSIVKGRRVDIDTSVGQLKIHVTTETTPTESMA